MYLNTISPITSIYNILEKCKYSLRNQEPTYLPVASIPSKSNRCINAAINCDQNRWRVSAVHLIRGLEWKTAIASAARGQSLCPGGEWFSWEMISPPWPVDIAQVDSVSMTACATYSHTNWNVNFIYIILLLLDGKLTSPGSRPATLCEIEDGITIPPNRKYRRTARSKDIPCYVDKWRYYDFEAKNAISIVHCSSLTI